MSPASAGDAVSVSAGAQNEQPLSPDAVALDDFFEMSLDNVCVAGFDGYFKRLNQSWTRTLGWSVTELMSRPSIEFVHIDDRDATLKAREGLRDGTWLWDLRNRYLCKDGGYRWFEWRSVSDPERGLVYAIARDVTQQIETDERLRKARDVEESLRRQLMFADRMASVGTLAAGVAHELNNPLTYVTTNISLILEAVNAPDQRGDRANLINDIRDMAQEAHAGAERIRKIVLGLKTFSRSEEERKALVEVAPLLDLSVNMTANEIRQRARLVRDYADTPPVWADESRLGQVFINLLINAAQAIEEGNFEANEIALSIATDAAGRVVIEVRDTGHGIAPEHIGRIFDPFFTTNPTGIGTGLGLSICHNIVTALGGHIHVTSVVGQGTTFRVILPAAQRRAQSNLPPSAPLPQQVANAQVLVVDDEPAIGASLTRALRHHTVTAVTSGKAALALLKEGQAYDVVFCDLMMPQMSGMEFFAQMRSEFPQMAERVVFMTGGAFTPKSHAFLDQTPNKCVDKPFEPQLAREIVQDFVKSRQR
ncbi:MAG: ATP-binding protein [Deltaproteobacteria bacterium]|nr:ATP-binding protein [Deltaproteobacteria bacterium]